MLKFEIWETMFEDILQEEEVKYLLRFLGLTSFEPTNLNRGTTNAPSGAKTKEKRMSLVKLTKSTDAGTLAVNLTTNKQWWSLFNFGERMVVLKQLKSENDKVRRSAIQRINDAFDKRRHERHQASRAAVFTTSQGLPMRLTVNRPAWLDEQPANSEPTKVAATQAA